MGHKTYFFSHFSWFSHREIICEAEPQDSLAHNFFSFVGYLSLFTLSLWSNCSGFCISWRVCGNDKYDCPGIPLVSLHIYFLIWASYLGDSEFSEAVFFDAGFTDYIAYKPKLSCPGNSWFWRPEANQSPLLCRYSLPFRRRSLCSP